MADNQEPKTPEELIKYIASNLVENTDEINIETVEEENKIILEHFLNNIDEKGYALDPETNEPIKCDSENKRVCNEVFEGISAKQLGILITEKRNDLITRFDHALYLGRELQKAEECLYKKLPYIQD